MKRGCHQHMRNGMCKICIVIFSIFLIFLLFTVRISKGQNLNAASHIKLSPIVSWGPMLNQRLIRNVCLSARWCNDRLWFATLGVRPRTESRRCRRAAATEITRVFGEPAVRVGIGNWPGLGMQQVNLPVALSSMKGLWNNYPSLKRRICVCTRAPSHLVTAMISDHRLCCLGLCKGTVFGLWSWHQPLHYGCVTLSCMCPWRIGQCCPVRWPRYGCSGHLCLATEDGAQQHYLPSPLFTRGYRCSARPRWHQRHRTRTGCAHPLRYNKNVWLWPRIMMFYAPWSRSVE